MTDQKTDLLNLFTGDNIGRIYDEACIHKEKYITPQRLAKSLTQYLKNQNLPDPKTCLALAVGTGLEAEQLKNIFPDLHITGVDLSSDMLRRALSADRINTPIQNNITLQTPQINNQSMDISVCCGGTEFNAGKLSEITGEMLRVTKPNGLMAITVRPPRQQAVREGYAYYTQDDVLNCFQAATFLGNDEHHSFSMMPSSQTVGDKAMKVHYNTLFFQNTRPI